MSDSRNRPDSKASTNDWFTPPEILRVLNLFDLDPACHPNIANDLLMDGARPWPRAVKCYCGVNGSEDDGLKMPWSGRVFLNPPWDDPLPWARKIAAHGDGIWLSPSKSLDAKWGQCILATADVVLFLAGRPCFCYPDGTPSLGKWSPVMLAAWGARNVEALRRAKAGPCEGILMGRLI